MHQRPAVRKLRLSPRASRSPVTGRRGRLAVRSARRRAARPCRYLNTARAAFACRLDAPATIVSAPGARHVDCRRERRWYDPGVGVTPQRGPSLREAHPDPFAGSPRAVLA